ncbi:MAG: 16S rRNA (cytidine(1402)-2'-O)-methyltransferase [Cyclobacteriaceae bacterium]|jgi:16S rRNA (cytidine1402-2'-O)-methyltransferase|nr:16S rRNA (cytidine(1402)-2'-O)-methyltransferase [Flammeovirgaceae bacterium]
MSGTALYIVPTPIGNLADITFRALDVLKSADIILAEDTRTSRVLLNHYNIERPLQSYHIFNEHQAVTRLIDRMKQGERFALISDAGTPGISDPGFLLVRETLKAGLAVDCLPGPTAFIPALIKSGFPTDRFVFEGFLPHKKGRQTALKQLAQEPRTIVLYESPHRLKKLIEELREHLGADRMISVSRELTKKFEETVTGSVAEVQAIFVDREVKGEIVVVIHGQEN